MEVNVQTFDITKVFQGYSETRKGPFGWVRNKVRPDRKSILAVDHVDISIERSEIFGLLGPNGAGKTTLVKMLCTLLVPTEGTARVNGWDINEHPEQVRRSVGVVLGGERALYWRLTGRENLWYFSQLYDIKTQEAKQKIQTALDLVGLTDRADDRVENYSKGMKQKLHIARVLLHDPEVLLLDEPTIGLDPKAAKDVRSFITRLAEEHGKTILLTTHYMFEADELSRRVAIIDRGRIIEHGSPKELKMSLRRKEILRLSVRSFTEETGANLASAPHISKVVRTGSNPSTGSVEVKILVDNGEEALPVIISEIVAGGGEILSLQSETPTLEDVFIELTGKTITGADLRASGHIEGT
ncbi:MAG: ATP-binding cassette domain-containing protein [Candidatus Geothermarchaeales archaeon]